MMICGSTVVVDRTRVATLSRVTDGARAPASRASVVMTSRMRETLRSGARSARGTIATIPSA
jgi:hypothetical protein